MSKVIIAIHGLSNKPRAEVIKKWWLLAIEEGLKNHVCQKYPKFRFEMVYWADVLYEKPKDENCTDPNNLLFVKEKYVPEEEPHKNEKHEVRKKIMDTILGQLNKIFLNQDYSLNFSSLSDLIIKRYFKDLDAYYSNEKNAKQQLVREELRNRLKKVLIKNRHNDVLLIAHSMGSIISFDVLTLYARNIKINSWITIGAPLGIPTVVSKIAQELNLKNQEMKKLGTPESVSKHWYNFSDLEDKVAFNYNLNDEFSENSKGIKVVDCVVSNNYSINGEHNPHKSYGYLRTPELSNRIFEFLTEKRGSLYQRCKNYVQHLFRNFNTGKEN